jgi:1-deoxy-D-xylulose-5-phosphate reductoisomerase
MNLAVLGATGSIGASTLDVVSAHPDRYRVFALSAHGSADALLELCRVHRPHLAVLSGMAEDRALRVRFGELNVELMFGGAALEAVATHPDCDAVMAAIVSRRSALDARRRAACVLRQQGSVVMAGGL